MIGKILGGRYELLEKIGGGGMAIVYKAKCHLLKRYVAVKILRPELVENEEFIARFKRESQSAASLSHHNIVNIYDVGQEDDIHYIVMEYVNGETLKEYIKRNGRIDSIDAARITLQICSALSHAHKRNIVHRDIKPQNILMDREGNVKVADFGIARAVTSATVTMAGANIIGSVHYFSPEQARGGFVDKKSDIYSLGIVLYEMVTGVVPFEGDSAISVAIKHIQEKVKPPGEINPDIPKGLQYIIEKAIEKDLDNRYNSAEAMAADLKEFIKDPDAMHFKSNDDAEAQTTKVLPPISINKENNIKPDEPRARKKEKSKKRKNILLVSAAVLFVILIIAGAYLLGKTIIDSNFGKTEVEVPDVQGKHEEDAERILNNYGLNMYVLKRVFDDEVPKDHIISQKPSPGMTVKSRSDVEVIISKGTETVTMPDLKGLDIRQAQLTLENYGLLLGEVNEVFSEIPKGQIADQSVPANTQVELNTKIDLEISKGPEIEQVILRDYTNIMENIAREMITDDGLKFNVAGREYNNGAEHGIVIRQEPKPGTSVDKNSVVDIWVSLGPEPMKEKKLIITYNGSEDVFAVRVVRVSDGIVIYDELHEIAEPVIEIKIMGSGTQKYDIYIDGEFSEQVEVNFDDSGD